MGNDEAQSPNAPLPTVDATRLVLRAATDADVEPLARAVADPGVAQWWPSYNATRIRRDIAEQATWAIEIDGVAAGWLHVHEESDPQYPSVSFDILLAPAYHGHGYGQEALRAAIDHYVAHGHHRFAIDPAADNARAIHSYEAVGFRPVGVMRGYERLPDGARRDGLLMDLLADELPG
ncbi:MAG: GNAT family N-acetyltransferase [Solirubrobacterales bacterium]